MFSLLTGKPYDHTTNDDTVKQPWTAEQYLAAMRRLLDQASKNNSDTPATRLLAAASVLAEAAKAAPKTHPATRPAPDGNVI